MSSECFPIPAFTNPSNRSSSTWIEQTPNVLPLTCGTRTSTIASRARDARERGPVPSGAAAG
jgi:hypothetical protein